ncbi:anaerobic ribonucleoside-triphosphate reductase activating protein [Ructibacterium gallinarum]|uniref:Anaerobic ribonucleoside-triphosphate reductase-activating protein n=1 Tax=Ructibacterium gallinarum TaxID=2779355 RepID=A0A9D5LXH5_9FIRM|nr:anaerobic ribonucleoside-triphosphate reductase activating protein [Ructibacterium gallinarum]MBE5039676.1 anaerobic ribonucleoside-triphosphate reductase activating protein [Ructibacterium gallinarum]
MKTLRISGIEPESIVDGPGIRYVVFVQGCPHHCKGCHNPQTHDFDGGHDQAIEEILDEIKKNPLLSGVTFSGGEPFCQPEPLTELGKEVKKLGLNLVCYSGYTFEELIKLSEKVPAVMELLQLSDLLVDGRFVLEEKSLMLKFRGSRNQRIVDVPASLAKGEVVLAEI